MTNNTFKCVDEKNELEKCKHCQCTDFILRESIVCAECCEFHKEVSKSAVSAAQMVEDLMEFARRHGE